MLDGETEREWLAWRAMCKELKRLGIEINAEDALADSIRQWGTRLVDLREHQATHGITA